MAGAHDGQCVWRDVVDTREPLGGEDVDVRVSYFFFDASKVLEQLFPAFGDSDSGDPLMQLSFGVDAKVSDVFRSLDLDLRMLDGEAIFGWRFVFLFPAGAVINLKNNLFVK